MVARQTDRLPCPVLFDLTGRFLVHPHKRRSSEQILDEQFFELVKGVDLELNPLNLQPYLDALRELIQRSRRIALQLPQRDVLEALFGLIQPAFPSKRRGNVGLYVQS